MYMWHQLYWQYLSFPIDHRSCCQNPSTTQGWYSYLYGDPSAANTLIQKDNKEKAIDQLNLFLEKNPSDYMARYNLALMYENTNKIDLAIKNYSEVQRRDQSHWRSRFNLYLILIKQKKFEDSLVLVNEVLKIKKNYQPALRDKALIYLNLKRPDEGFQYIIDSLKENPQDHIAMNTLGMIFLEL